jgi:MFS family permease
MIRSPEPLLCWWLRRVGGPARGRALIVLALALALDAADLGTIGAVAGELENALSLSNTQLGLLAAIPSVCSAVVTVPMGLLVDRTNRVRLLWIAMLAWSAVQAVSATAGSFELLLLIRLGLGAATAVTLPAVASLVGDLFGSTERARIWGLILGGELIGAAFGYVVAGEVASFGSGSWRLAFLVLAIPSLAGALVLRRWLDEPVRGGGGQLAFEGGTDATGSGDATSGGRSTEPERLTAGRAQREVRSRGVKPYPEQVLHANPEDMGLIGAGRYILGIRTNAVLIVASALGYFYFTGIQTFGLVYFQGRFHLSHGMATLALGSLAIGGLAGVIGGGRLADWGLRRGWVNSRIAIGACSYAVAALLFLPGLLTSSLVAALPLMMIAGVAFGGREPPLDAARLDIMHHRLWGRAESVRTFLRRTMTATAPIVFGLIADALAPPAAGGHANGAHGFGANADAHGLELASLVLLTTLVLGGLCTFAAMRTYPRDVATALASEAETPAPAGAAAEMPAPTCDEAESQAPTCDEAESQAPT